MKKIQILIRKEIQDILRDKKTLIMMVVVPVLLYPLMIIGITLIMGHIMQSQGDTTYEVGYDAKYEDFVSELQTVYGKQDEVDAILRFETNRREDADVWMDITEEEGRYNVKLEYTSTDQNSGYAESALEELLDIYREELLVKNLKDEGLTEDFLYPVSYEAADCVSVSESVGMDIGGSIGMLLITTILLGSFYPAIDATTGEKERGTLETLLTLPVNNFQMIMSKYITVALFACVTAVISMLSLGGSVLFLLFGVSDEISMGLDLSFGNLLPVIPIILLTLLTVALLITAVCMVFCVFAKSFKEANNYMTPVMLIVMFSSMAGMIPSVRLSYTTALVPIMNVSLMVKQILSQQFSMGMAGIVIGINLAYSVLIVWILSKIYDSEDILFSDGVRGFRLFQKRTDIRKGTVPQSGDLLVIVVAAFLLLIYVGTIATAKLGIGGVAIQQLLILAVPLLAVWYLKSDLHTLFSFHKPKIRVLPGSVFLYLGTYCIVMGISVILSSFLTESAGAVSESFGVLAEAPVLIMLLVTAVMPAVGEEILFRGLIFGSLRYRHGIKIAIVVSAIVFGIFHMSLVKFIPTALLGACFAYIVWKSGSIYISMCLHFLNNALSMLILKYPDSLGKALPILLKESLTAGELLVVLALGIILAGAGIFLLERTKVSCCE